MPKKKQSASKPAASGDESRLIREAVARAQLSASRLDYLRSNNPLHLLHGLVAVKRGGVHLPDWILKPFAEAALMVLADETGKLTMDAGLGLKVNKGHRTRLQEQAQREKDERFTWLVEERPRLAWQMQQEDDRLIKEQPHLAQLIREGKGPRLRGPITTTTEAIEQAMDALHPNGGYTDEALESALQRYNKQLKTTRRSRR